MLTQGGGYFSPRMDAANDDEVKVDEEAEDLKLVTASL